MPRKIHVDIELLHVDARELRGQRVTPAGAHRLPREQQQLPLPGEHLQVPVPFHGGPRGTAQKVADIVDAEV